jgi:uncharacterized protein YbbK (DUF523 family)
MYVISACLLGVNCKYNGGNNYDEKVIEFLEGKDYIAICPEELVGLIAPREPTEIIDGRAIGKDGKDLTELFNKSALKSYEVSIEKAAKLNQKIELAILKARSPSCGCGKIYDGTFSGKLIPGNGFTSEYFIKKEIKVITEEDL